MLVRIFIAIHLVNLLDHRSRGTKRYAECHLNTRGTAMFAIRQIHNDPADVIPVPPKVDDGQQTSVLASLAGCWEGELERAPQGEYETCQEWD